MKESASVYDTNGQQRLSDYLESSDLLEFTQQVTEDGRTISKFLSFTFPIPQFDPLACLEMLSDTKNDFSFYWEKPNQQLALSAGGALSVLRNSDGSNRFQAIAKQVNDMEQHSSSYSAIEHSLSGIHFLGGFSFFDNVTSPWWKTFGTESLTVPKWLLIRDGKLGLLTISLKNKSEDNQSSILKKLEQQLQRFQQLFHIDTEFPEFTYGSQAIDEKKESDNLDHARSEWTNMVEDAKKLINKKKFNKIVLAREVISETASPVSPTRILNTLRDQYPSCYIFLVKNKEGKAFLGSSPERLVSFKKNYLLTDSLAGSVSRGKTATEDIHLEKFLLNSSKNRREHQYVTSSIEKNLLPFIRKIERADRPDVKKLKNVQHLYTPLRAWLKKDTKWFSILEQLHPTPAVGGHPRDEAVSYIKKLENFDRGWYAGPVGWFNLNGGGEFAVAIRSSLIDGNCVRAYAGCGIVEDSDPQAEWEETNLKLMPILSALETNEGRQAE